MTHLRRAERDDVAQIVRLLADDDIGRLREDVSGEALESYYRAFEKIDGDRNQELIVAEGTDKDIVGTLQLSFLRHLTHRGGLRTHVEAVRVKGTARGTGVGRQMLQWAVSRARDRGAHLVQLTTDKRRPGARKFYERMGFAATHEGMKLLLEEGSSPGS